MLCEILALVEKGTIGLDAGKRVADEIFTNGGTPEEVVQKLSLVQVSDEGELQQLVSGVLAANAKSVEDYKGGKSNAFAFLVGQCMKASKGKANPKVINELLRKELEG